MKWNSAAQTLTASIATSTTLDSLPRVAGQRRTILCE